MTTNQMTPVPTMTLPYHRTALAQPTHRWWRPIVTLAVTFVTWQVLVFVFDQLFGLAFFSIPAMEALTEEEFGVPSMNRPFGAFYSLGMIALLLPALAVGLRVSERRSIGTMSSVAGRLRRGLLTRNLVVAALVFLATTGLLTGAMIVVGDTPAPQITPYTAGLLAVALLLVPIQAAAEEYVFRGLPQQTFGAWLKNPWVGILVPVPLFAFAHLYNTMGLISTAIVALAAGILTWRTGGLEAAIALHVVNNVAVFVFGAFGMADLSATEVAPMSTLASAVSVITFSTIVLVRQRRDEV